MGKSDPSTDLFKEMMAHHSFGFHLQESLDITNVCVMYNSDLVCQEPDLCDASSEKSHDAGLTVLTGGTWRRCRRRCFPTSQPSQRWLSCHRSE